MIPKLFDKILVANRGEIAVRIMRTARKMGISTVAVYSESDAAAAHVKAADQAVFIGADDLHASYLNIRAILQAALESGAQAIHPGYGFLSENPAFAAACQTAGLVFIGPDPEAIRLMGNKIAARDIARKIGVPLIDGIHGSRAEILENATHTGFPLLVKAAAGGGGKGMRVVRHQEDLKEALEATSREAQAYFGDGSVFVERFVEEPRHIEVQVLGDKHGNMLHLFERECTIQRRHQKIIEEAPSVTLTPAIRQKMTEAAVHLASRIGYHSAGTIEFLVDHDLNFYFLEMNTRIQVEHPVTEFITGIDIVEEQIRVAAGYPLRFRQEQIKSGGHAIEVRIYAEDPTRNFQPSPGEVTLIHFPSGKGIRNDASLQGPGMVHSFFDPMISKLTCHGKDRPEALALMSSALQDFAVQGIATNLEYLAQIMQDNLFAENKISTHYCEAHSERLNECNQSEKNEVPCEIPIAGYLAFNYLRKINPEPASIWERIGYWRLLPQVHVILEETSYTVHFSGQGRRSLEFRINSEAHRLDLVDEQGGRFHIRLNGRELHLYVSEPDGGPCLVTVRGKTFRVQSKEVLIPQEFFRVDTIHSHEGKITSPMPGKVTRILVEEGDLVMKDSVLLVVEAMKMENNILAPMEGIVAGIHVETGEMVDPSKELIIIQNLNNE